MIAIEGDDVADEAAVRIIGGRFDRDVCCAEKLGQLVRAHRHPAHDTEGATSAAFQSPEQIGIGARIRDSNLAVGGDDFGFEQAARGGAIALGVASKATALDQTREADGQASAALDVYPRFGCDHVVRLHSNDAGAERNRRLRLHHVLASARNERVMHRDIVHVARPDEKRIGRIGSTLIAMTSALDHEA